MSSPRASTEHAKPNPRVYAHIYLESKCLCPAMPSPRAYTMIPMKAGLPVQCQAYHGVLFKEDCMIYHASDCFLHFCHNLQACKASAHLLVWAAYCYYVARLISLSFQSFGFTSFSTCPASQLSCNVQTGSKSDWKKFRAEHQERVTS